MTNKVHDSFSMHPIANSIGQQIRTDMFRLLICHVKLSMDYVVIVQQDRFHRKQPLANDWHHL